MTVQMKTKTAIVYGGIPRKPNDLFHASISDAAVLTAMGAAEKAEDTAAADSPPADESLAPARRSPRRYKRRDMVAEGDRE